MILKNRGSMSINDPVFSTGNEVIEVGLGSGKSGTVTASDADGDSIVYSAHYEDTDISDSFAFNASDPSKGLFGPFLDRFEHG